MAGTNNWPVPAGSPGTMCWPGTNGLPHVEGIRKVGGWSRQSDLHAGPAVHAVAERTRPSGCRTTATKSSGTPASTWAMPTPRSSTRIVPTTGARSTRPGTTPNPPSPSRPTCIEDGRLYIPKRGWMRLGPIHRYADGQPLTVRVWQESESKQPKWYAYIVFEVPEDHPDVCRPAETGAVGIDRNTGHGQHGRSPLPDTTRGRQDQAVPAPDGPAAEGLPPPPRDRRTAQTPAQEGPAPGQRHAPNQPQGGGHGPHRRARGPEHQGHAKSAKGTVENPGKNVQPCHPGDRLGPAGASARTRPASCGSSSRPTLRRPAANAGTRPGRRRRCSRAEPAGSKRTPTTMRRSTSWCGRDARSAHWGCCTARSASLVGRKAGTPATHAGCVVSTCPKTKGVRLHLFGLEANQPAQVVRRPPPAACWQCPPSRAAQVVPCA